MTYLERKIGFCMDSKKRNVLLLFAFVLLQILIFPILYYCFITQKQTLVRFNRSAIENVYVLNMDRSVERRNKYEERLKKTFGNEFLGKSFDEIRFKTTDATKDLIIINKTKNERMTGKQFINKERHFELNNLYHIYDIKDPKFVIKYRPSVAFPTERQKWQRASGGTAFITIGHIGATFSHLRAIKDIAEKGYAMGLILEDDFEIMKPDSFYDDLDKYLSQTPMNFNILKLDIFSEFGHGVKNRLKIKKRDFIKSFFKYGSNKYFISNVFKTHMGTAYIVSNEGARQITEFVQNHIFNQTFVIDDLLYVMLPYKFNFNGIWYAKKPLITQEDFLNNYNKWKNETSECSKLAVH